MRLSAVLLLVVGPLSASAQLPDVLPGSRVRVESQSLTRRAEGTVMGHAADSMVIAVSGAVRTAVPHSSIRRLQVSQGKSRAAGAIKGAKVGALVGGGSVLILMASFAGASEIRAADAIAITGAYTVSGGLWGLLIGSLVGAEKWQTVYSGPGGRTASLRRPIALTVAKSFSF